MPPAVHTGLFTIVNGSEHDLMASRDLRLWLQVTPLSLQPCFSLLSFISELIIALARNLMSILIKASEFFFCHNIHINTVNSQRRWTSHISSIMIVPTYIDLTYSTVQGIFTSITTDCTHTNQAYGESLDTVIILFTDKDS